MAGSLLRDRDGQQARVGFVELFFDLVFVFAITQISHTLLAHLTWIGALQAMMLLAAVWWAWIYTSWVTNWLDPEKGAVQAGLFVLMGLGLAMSASVSDAFADAGLVFAIAFVAIQVGRTLFMLWAARGEASLAANFHRVLIWLLVSGLFWIGGGLAAPEHRIALWIIALLIDYAAPALAFRVPGLGRSQTTDWTVEGGHIAERVGLFVIICLGETLLVSGATFAGLDWTLPVVIAFVSAMLSTVGMWLLYFSRAHEAASETIADADDPGALARRAYTYSPILIVAGIIVVAVSDELVLAHPAGHVAPAAALTLLGGPALFLIGTTVSTFAVWQKVAWARLAGCMALAAGWLSLPWTTPLILSVISTAVLFAVFLWETLARRRRSA